jgi:RNA polymerase sigma-70 factor (ECF subfamily)
VKVFSTALPHTPVDPAAVRSNQGAMPFAQVYSEYFPFVWRCLRGLGLQAGVVDDAAQDVFLVVHRQLETFRGQSSMRTWLFGILRNVASNYRRRTVRKEGHNSGLRGDVTHTAPGPLENAQNAQAAAFVQTFLADLDEKKRSVFILGVLEEMSIPEVAATLSIPLNTAYTRLRRAREDFQRALADRRGGQ